MSGENTGVVAPSEVSPSEMQAILRGLGTDFSERVAMAVSFFRSTAQSYRGPYFQQTIDRTDKELLFWCQVLAQIHGAQNEPFCSLLTDELYWDLPLISHRTGYDPINWAPFIETKKWMWEKVIKQWNPSMTAYGKNLDLFLFFIAAFNPRAKDDDPLEDESPYERKARGRFITPYEQGEILELIHKRIKNIPVFLDQWLAVPRVPIEIKKKLAHAWVNERGWLELPRLFARSAAIGDPRVEKCSAEGLITLRGWCDLLTNFDGKLQRLLCMLRAINIPPEVAIAGAYGTLLTNANLRIEINADFKERYSREETRVIFNYILAVIAEWEKGEQGEFTDGVGVFVHGRKIDVVIHAEGKRGAFDSFEFSSST